MAIRSAFQITTFVIGDGNSTTFQLDLANDAYSVGPSGPILENWFTQDRKFPAPTGVELPNSGQSVSLSGTIVTITFSTPPVSNTVTSVGFFVIF